MSRPPKRRPRRRQRQRVRRPHPLIVAISALILVALMGLVVAPREQPGPALRPLTSPSASTNPQTTVGAGSPIGPAAITAPTAAASGMRERIGYVPFAVPAYAFEVEFPSLLDGSTLHLQPSKVARPDAVTHLATRYGTSYTTGRVTYHYLVTLYRSNSTSAITALRQAMGRKTYAHGSLIGKDAWFFPPTADPRHARSIILYHRGMIFELTGQGPPAEPFYRSFEFTG